MVSASVLAWLLLVAQEAPAESPKATATVLHLEGGAVLRAKARQTEAGAWEVFRDGAWQTLPAGSVQRARPERELLAEAGKLEHGLPRGDKVRRVAYADWLVSEGLVPESLKQLDRVLTDDPDQSDALALLARARFGLALPPAPGADAAAGEAFFAAAARLAPAARELAVNELAHASDGLGALLAKELVHRSSARREFATLALRRIFPGTEVKGLLSRAILDPASEVREGAALALRDCRDASVIAPALRAVESKHADVRANAIEALGRMNYREAVEPLFTHLVSLQGTSSAAAGAPRAFIFVGKQFAYVQDFDVEVAQNAAIADPIINILAEGTVLDAAVIGVTEYQIASERAGVRRALSQLTGAKPGDTTVAWQRWWDEHGADWRAGAAPPESPTTPADQG